MLVLQFLDRHVKIVALGTLLGIFYSSSFTLSLYPGPKPNFLNLIIGIMAFSAPIGSMVGFVTSSVFSLLSSSLSDNFWPLSKISLTLVFISLGISCLFGDIVHWLFIVLLNFLAVFYFCFDHGPSE